jgi:hypothetical protein
MKIKEERDELEKIINNSSEKIGKEVKPAEAPELAMEPAFHIDFEELQKDCEMNLLKTIPT